MVTPREANLYPRTNRTERMMHTTARDSAPYGVPLVNTEFPALSMPEVSDLTGVGITPLNNEVRAGRLPGGYLDFDGRPVLDVAMVDAVREHFGRVPVTA